MPSDRVRRRGEHSLMKGFRRVRVVNTQHVAPRSPIKISGPPCPEHAYYTSGRDLAPLQDGLRKFLPLSFEFNGPKNSLDPLFEESIYHSVDTGRYLLITKLDHAQPPYVARTPLHLVGIYIAQRIDGLEAKVVRCVGMEKFPEPRPHLLGPHQTVPLDKLAIMVGNYHVLLTGTATYVKPYRAKL